MAELKLREVQREILFADVMVCAYDTALEERPEVFDVVRVNLAAHIFALTVADRIVREAHRVQVAVSGKIIGRDQINVAADRLLRRSG